MDNGPNIEKVPFRKYSLEEKQEGETIVISLKLNKEEQALLSSLKSILEQEKDGTCIKQALLIAKEVLLDQKVSNILSIIYSNKRKNKRLGIIEFEQ